MTSAGNEKDNENATKGGEGQGPDEEIILRRMLNTPPKPHKGSKNATSKHVNPPHREGTARKREN